MFLREIGNSIDNNVSKRKTNFVKFVPNQLLRVELRHIWNYIQIPYLNTCNKKSFKFHQEHFQTSQVKNIMMLKR